MPPLSASSDAASIPGERQSLGSPVGNLPVPNIVHCLRLHDDRKDQEAWMPIFVSVVSPVDANRYLDNEVEEIPLYESQKK